MRCRDRPDRGRITHAPTDTPDKLAYAELALMLGLFKTFAALAREGLG